MAERFAFVFEDELCEKCIIKEFICFANKDFYALPCLFYSYLELGELGSLK